MNLLTPKQKTELLVKKNFAKGDKIVVYSRYLKRDWGKGIVISSNGIHVWFKDCNGQTRMWDAEDVRLEEDENE